MPMLDKFFFVLAMAAFVIATRISSRWWWGRVWGFEFLKGDQYNKKQVRTLRKKIENYEYLTQEEFALWRKHDIYPPYKTYDAYIKDFNMPKEEREKRKKEIWEFLENSPEFQGFLKKLGLNKK